MSQLPAALIVGCTNRKRAVPCRELQASSLPLGDQRELVAVWRQRLRSASRETRVGNLYCGRGFKESLHAATQLGGPLWIISAGLGLVNSYDRSTCYDLTIAPNSEQSIQRHVRNGDFDARLWWREINAGNSPLASLVAHEAPRGRLFIISLSSQYQHLVSDDLLEIAKQHRTSLRILSRNDLDEGLRELAPYTLIYEDYLDGPDTPLPGTGADFASRMARHFSQYIWPQDPFGSLQSHQELLKAVCKA